MVTDTSSIRKFLDLQYGDDKGVAWIGAKIGTSFEDKGFEWPAQKEALFEYVVATNNAGGNVWFAAHLSHNPTSRAKGQSVRRRRLHVDIDRELTDDDVARIRQLDAWVVYSGSPGHVHAYIDLDRSVDVGTYHRLEDMLVAWFGSDQAVCRDNGLLRIPGTMNQMGGKKPYPPAMVTWDGESAKEGLFRQWAPEDLLAMVPGHVVEKVSAKVEAQESFGQSPIEMQQVEIPRAVMDAILTHWDDRSSKTAHLVNTCKAVGLSLEATLFCVLGDEGQRQRYREKGYAFMFREIRKLYGTADEYNPQLKERADDAALGMDRVQVGERVSAEVLQIPLSTEAGLEGARVLSEQEQDELDTQLLLGMTVAAPSGPLSAQQQVENALARSSWGPMDFSGVLDGTYQAPQPTMFTRTDGVSLLYPGLTHSFHGEPESGKSLIAQIECIRQINSGHDVLYIDFEDGMTGVISRFLEFGADPTMLKQHLAYVRPHENFNAEAPEWQRLMLRRFALAVLDGVTESMSLTGHELNDNSDIAKWQQMLPNTIARETGAAVVIIDHVTKSNEGRGRAAIGGQHKLAGLSGAAYLIEIDQPLGRGNHGIVVMRLAKDRPGYLRERCGEYRKGDRTQEAARVIVDSTTCGLTGAAPDVTVSPWEAVITEEQREAALARSIFDCVSHNPGINRRTLQDKLRASGIKFKTTVLGPTLADMVGMEQLRTEKGPHNSVEYHAGIWGEE